MKRERQAANIGRTTCHHGVQCIKATVHEKLAEEENGAGPHECGIRE